MNEAKEGELVDISVIVCAKNSEKTIEECLESVARNNPLEIIVVDGDSTDSTVKIAKKYTDKVYSDEGKGLGHARQLGAEKAESGYVAYVDSDVILPENCLPKMITEMEEKGYTGIHAQIIALQSRNYWEWAEDQYFRIRFNKEGERDAIGCIAAVYKRDSILRYKFDPFFAGASEDGDLFRRLRKDGLTLGISSAFAYHQHRASAKGFIKQRIWYGKGNARLFWKHKTIINLAGASLMIPFGIFVCIKRRSLKMLPYYLVWSISGNVGMLRELSMLVLKKLMSKVP